MVNPLKIAIIAAGRPQYELARVAGLSETRLSRLATGRVQPSADERRVLAEALGVAISQLFPEAGP